MDVVAEVNEAVVAAKCGIVLDVETDIWGDLGLILFSSEVSAGVALENASVFLAVDGNGGLLDVSDSGCGGLKLKSNSFMSYKKLIEASKVMSYLEDKLH